MLLFFFRKKERNGNGRIFKDEIERKRGRKIDSFGFPEGVLSPIPGIGIRSGQVASSFDLENPEPATRFGSLTGYSPSLGACGVRALSWAILSLP
jgi:hypothetical protein